MLRVLIVAIAVLCADSGFGQSLGPVRPKADDKPPTPRRSSARPRGNPDALIQPPLSVINSDPGPMRPTLFGPLDLKTLRRAGQSPPPPAGPVIRNSLLIGRYPTGGFNPGLRFVPGQIPLPGGKNLADRGGYQMTSYRNANNGLTTIVYDQATHQARAYDQSVSFGTNYGGPLPPGISRPMPGGAIGVNTWPNNSLSGPISNPSLDQVGPYATGRFSGDPIGGPSGSLGSINSAIPSYGGVAPTGFGDAPGIISGPPPFPFPATIP